MEISKAIEILELNIKVAGKKMPPDVQDAVQLGVEAFKRIQDGRHEGYSYFGHLLPSETLPDSLQRSEIAHRKQHPKKGGG